MDATKFKLGACTLTYKSTVLGATDGGPKFDFEPEYYESKCDQSGGRVVRKICTNVKITVSAAFKEIDDAFTQILDATGKITTSEIGKDLLTGGGALLLTPIDAADTHGYSFPNAVIVPKGSYSFKAEEDHTLELQFEIYADESGVLMERTTIGA
jgi:hypothetical protein